MNVFREWADRTLQSDYMRKIACLPLLEGKDREKTNARQDILEAMECAAKAVRQELKLLNYVDGEDEPDGDDWLIAAVAVNAYFKKLHNV